MNCFVRLKLSPSSAKIFVKVFYTDLISQSREGAKFFLVASSFNWRYLYFKKKKGFSQTIFLAKALN
ncbi:hypothetical protein ASD98_13815 [Flavobacterium sp. Root186]|nr:hypothetical protein ASD98_13815 [Flavobacterium sp. Root186]